MSAALAIENGEASVAIPEHESYSSLTTYAICPRRYGYRYVERVPGLDRAPWFAIGSALHAALESYVTAEIVNPGIRPEQHCFWDALDATLAVALVSAEEGAILRQRAEVAFRAFEAREAAAEATPLAVELGFGVAVDVDREPVRFVGYVDRVNRLPDGSIEIIDYKAGHAPELEVASSSRQLSAYALAAAAGALRDPATRETLPAASRLALWYPEDDVVHWTTRDALSLAAFRAWLAHGIRGIRRRAFDARPSLGRCGDCEYDYLCRR